MDSLYEPGNNIAIKVPAHEFQQTVAFYRDVLSLKVIEDTWSPDNFDTIAFDFAGKTLWLDRKSNLSQAEIWLEIKTKKLDRAKQHLTECGCTIYDEIEPLPGDYKGFWISSPSNIIHLINE
ncbi:MAG: hypothetical protein OEZ58_24195 [Gammaproteobacteria bacterium]|nr:hypothetical protein [Gammaproteobacteria bacterium]MDH5732098.1 hypothetical protein [Gammaproteobacteria bacterium]